MDVRPGVGFGDVVIGESRRSVVDRLGTPPTTHRGDSFYVDRDPALVIRFNDADVVELVEVPCTGQAGADVTLAGVRLARRPLDEVIADLASAGFVGRPSDIGFEYAEGFAVWSMGSLRVADIDPDASETDERNVVEGVSVGAPAYFGF